MTKKRIYLAGPDVFFPNAKEHFARLKEQCASYGFEGLSPLDNEVALSSPPSKEDAYRIFDLNRDMILSCDGMLANLTPFRGPSADVGTVWELGYASALGKVVAAYSTDGRSYVERVTTDDGMAIENFGLRDNLMLEGSLFYRHMETTFISALIDLKGQFSWRD